MKGDYSIYGVDSEGKTLFLHSCPFWILYHSPAIIEVSKAYNWLDKGALHMKYPRGISYALTQALEQYEAGYRKGAREKIDEQRNKHKQNAAKYKNR